MSRKAEQKTPSPSALAEDFLHRSERMVLGGEHTGAKKLLYWRGEWWRWDGVCFQRFPGSDLKGRVSEFLESREDVRDSVSSHKRRSIIEVLEGMCLVDYEVEPPAWLPPAFGYDEPKVAPHRIALKNGILSINSYLWRDDVQGVDQELLERDMLLPLSPAFFSFAGLPVEYDPEAQCPRWTDFLSEVLPDRKVRTLLHQVFGYCMTNGQQAQKFIVLHGEAGTGKSTTLRILEAMLGPENCSHIPLESFSSNFALAGTVGKLANLCGDLGESDRISEGRLKEYTGGDTMTVERKFRDPFSFKPSAKLIFSTNTVPRFRDRSDGVWRRLVIIPFGVVIPEGQQDPGLADKLKGELSGILNWALGGLYSLHHSDYQFIEPQVCQEAKEEHRRESNMTRVFLEECVQDGGHEGILTIQLYEKYKDWIQARGYRALGERSFGKELASVFGEGRRVRRRLANGKRVYIYEGITLQ